MDFLTWEQNRHRNLELLQETDLFTDVCLVVEGERFPSHRVVLAAHSQYFYTMFTCGMTETRNQEIPIHGLSAPVFRIVLNYIYRGRVDTSEVEALKGAFLAANMLQVNIEMSSIVLTVDLLILLTLQMSDLEHITVNKLHKLCNLANCIDMYFFVTTYCDIEAHTGRSSPPSHVVPDSLLQACTGRGREFCQSCWRSTGAR